MSLRKAERSAPQLDCERRDVVGFEGIYFVTEDGRVFRYNAPVYDSQGKFRYIKRAREILGEITKQGYRRVLLSKNGVVSRCLCIGLWQKPFSITQEASLLLIT